MKTQKPLHALTLLLLAALAPLPALAQPPMEYLTRGLVAVHQGDGKVFLSWRLLGTDPDDVAFNLYRFTSFGNAPTLLNKEPIRGGTNFVDTGVRLDENTTYSVRPVLKGAEIAERARDFTLPAHAPVRQYLEVPLKTPKGYAPNDCSAADLGGDGDYDLVVHMVGRGRDNSQNGPTDPPILQGYKLDGTLLWTINLGRNIREGAHYTQFMAYDLDGDGVGDDGRILKGPEFLTVFNGRTGAAMATVPYVPDRGDIGGWGGIGGP